MRAGNLDIVIETGAYWSREIQVVAPDQPIEAHEAIIGERYYVDGRPLELYSIEPASGGRVRLTFNKGLYSDPSLLITSTANITPAVPVEILAMEASFSVAGVDVDGNETLAQVPIPVEIAPDSFSGRLSVDAVTTATWWEYEGAHSWDCYAQSAAWDWQRILEGTLTVICGDTR